VNWDAVGAIAEILGGLTVVATVIYLAMQIRQIKDQTDRSTLHHVIDGVKDFTSSIAESDELASIIVRERASYSSLPDVERLRFESSYLSLLNVLESWCVGSSYGVLGVEEKRTQQELRKAILFYCDSSGFREV
jgi:hypothetical protein